MPKKFTPARTRTSSSRKSSMKPIWVLVGLIIAVIALVGGLALVQQNTENRNQAAATKFPMAVFATSATGPEVTNANNMLDGNISTFWNSGGFPKRWVTFRFQKDELVKTIRMIPAQTPAGPTVTNIYTSINPPTSSNFGTLVKTFNGNSADGQNIIQTLPNAVPARYITIETTQGPSFVAWREIEVYPDGATIPAPSPAPAVTPTPSSVETKYQLSAQGTTSPVAASSTSPNLALDGNAGTFWNAGSFPNRWIAVKLNSPGDVSRIKLNVAQTPAGATTHKVYTSATAPTQGNFGTLVHTFAGNTSDGQVLDKAFSAPLKNIQYVTVETTQSPSFVAWREIEVYKPASAPSFPLPVDTAPKSGYTMIFSDEFDCPMVDNVASACRNAFYDKWYTRYVYADGTQDFLNPQIEIERYRDNGNHVVSNGTLKLIAKKTGTYSASNPQAPIYESGMIRSKQTFSEGTYWEASLKHNKTAGTFSAFWFIPRNGAWPPEIDIVETWLWDPASTMNFARMGVRGFPNTNFLTYSDPQGQYNAGDGGYIYNNGIDYSAGFHKFGLEWTKDGRYIIYVDGKRVAEYSGPGMFDSQGRSTNPVDLILNQAVIKPNNLQFAQSLQLEAEYVRVYKKN